MKHLILTLFTLHFSLFTLSASAAVPLKWTVETSRATPAQIEAYQGETLTFEAALQSYGKPIEAPLNYSLYWQTNGMGNAWWSVPCNPTIRQSDNPTISNVLFATWSPTNDVGAKVYNCFIGQPGTIYHAAFQLRLRPSPGATPNELPLPQKVIDFAKVTVLNPPWSGGGGGGVDTNAVIDIIHKTVDGSARTLPPYLHYLEMDDTYPDAAAEWYAQADYSHGSCSARRAGNLLERNYDWNFDFMPEFVVRCVATASSPSCPGGRFASLAVCNVGTSLTEASVTSGKWSKWYKALPGHAVDGINENGVVCEVNVCPTNGVEGWTGTEVHCLGGVRYALDHATNAAHAASLLAEKVYVPQGYGNFHYMVADATSTYIVENGEAYLVPSSLLEGAVLTNFRLYPTRDTSGEGQERYDALVSGASITSQWWTLTYTPDGYRASDLPGITGEDLTSLFNYWENNPRESHRGERFGNKSWWQTVHCSVYDITNRTLRICVQETDDWYTFAVPSAGGVKPEAVREIVTPMIDAATNGLRRVEDMAVYEVVRTENTDWTWHCDDPVLLSALFGVKPIPSPSSSYDGYYMWNISFTFPQGYIPGGMGVEPYSRDALELIGYYAYKPDGDSVSYFATRPRYMDERIATSTNAALAAVVTNGTGAVATGDMVKLGANGRLVKATAGTDYADEAAGTDRQVVRGELSTEDGIWMIQVLASDNAGKASMDDSGNVITETYATKTELSAKQDALPYPTNAIPASVITGLEPPTSPTLRVYDDVRLCWWLGRMVNGVINWEVE